MRCNVCRDSQAIGRCGVCRSPVCPAHRWSTGHKSDGYYCVSCTPVSPVSSPHHGAPAKPSRMGYLMTMLRGLLPTRNASDV